VIDAFIEQTQDVLGAKRGETYRLGSRRQGGGTIFHLGRCPCLLKAGGLFGRDNS